MHNASFMAPAALVLLGAGCSMGAAEAANTTPLTLETIMADPDWMGPAVLDPYWSADGRSVYYSLKRKGSPLTDLHQITLTGGVDAIVEPDARANADSPAVYDRSGARAAFIRNGDVFVRVVASGKLIQITRSPQTKGSPQFSADGKLLSFRGDDEWFVHDFASGITAPATCNCEHSRR
jgi:Tol biopolymer transport system component